MEAVTCPRCGGDVPVGEAGAPEAGVGVPLTLGCPGCAARLEVSVFVDGAETLFHPQLLPVDAAPDMRPPEPDPGATIPLGSRTAMLEPEPDERPGPATVARASLILTGAEPGNERTMLTEPTTTVGREGADVEIPDPAMSARHFAIELHGNEHFVRDLASSNGTFLNGDLIRVAELASGDTIRAGQSSFTFRIFETIAME